MQSGERKSLEKRVLPVGDMTKGNSLPLEQNLLQSPQQLREEEREPSLADESLAGAEDGGSERELPGAESGRAGAQSWLRPSQPAEGQSQWMSIPCSPRQRHLCCCFGTGIDGGERQGWDGTGTARRFLEQREKLKAGLAPKSFLIFQDGVQQPHHQAGLGPATAAGYGAINFVPSLHCLF
ncbi:uncharacterized protein M8220_012954 isoform 2-T2 [Acridotheres tristis]